MNGTPTCATCSSDKHGASDAMRVAAVSRNKIIAASVPLNLQSPWQERGQVAQTSDRPISPETGASGSQGCPELSGTESFDAHYLYGTTERHIQDQGTHGSPQSGSVPEPCRASTPFARDAARAEAQTEADNRKKWLRTRCQGECPDKDGKKQECTLIVEESFSQKDTDRAGSVERLCYVTTTVSIKWRCGCK